MSAIKHETKRHAGLGLVHVSFASHYITVRCDNTELLSRFAGNIEPMLALGPVGVQAGDFQVFDIDGQFVIRDRRMAADERSYDLHCAARLLHHCVIKRFIDVRADLLWIHAAAVQIAGGGILLAGTSGQGKSTMVDALLDWECTYLSDEVAPIDPARAAVLPFPVSPHKRIGTGARLPADRIHELAKIPVHVPPALVSQAPAPISQIYFLRHDPACSATRFEQCSPAVCVVEMLTNSFNSEGSRDTEVQNLCQLISKVNAAYLIYGEASEAASRVISAAALAQASTMAKS